MEKETGRTCKQKSATERPQWVGFAECCAPSYGTKLPFLGITVSVGFRENLPVAIPDGQRRHDNNCGCRVNKMPIAEAAEKHLIVAPRPE